MIDFAKFSSIFVANWKLNGNLEFIDKYIDALKNKPATKNCVILCPPCVYINNITSKSHFFIGAQDVSHEEEGAFTGEVSAKMLSDLSVKFCIIGHSERRQHFYEKNSDIKIKARLLIENEIIPIICVGENEEQKNLNLTNKVIFSQLEECLPDISNSKNTIIAYEPIWSIGTGATPKLEEIESCIFELKNYQKMENYKILYGGSVNFSNSGNICNLNSVDGVLIGGASLKIEEFSQIINY
tara:strand:- start:260 stop:982 length:723 start_codon:yes stop_codon:yes gene_type:complete